MRPDAQNAAQEARNTQSHTGEGPLSKNASQGRTGSRPIVHEFVITMDCGAVYSVFGSKDEEWLKQIPAAPMSNADLRFMLTILEESHLLPGSIHQHVINILTINIERRDRRWFTVDEKKLIASWLDNPA